MASIIMRMSISIIGYSPNITIYIILLLLVMCQYKAANSHKKEMSENYSFHTLVLPHNAMVKFIK